MTPEARETLNRQSYLAPIVRVDGLELRRLSAWTLDLCIELGIVSIVGSAEQKQAQTPQRRTRELIAVLWLLSQPEDVVDDVVYGLASLEAETKFDAFWSEHGRAFSRTVAVGVINQIEEIMDRVGQESRAANFEIVEKPPVEGAAAEKAAAPGNS